MLRQRTDEELADYDKGFETGQSGGQNDDTKSQVGSGVVRGAGVTDLNSGESKSSTDIRTPCPIATELLAEQFRSAVIVARTILNERKLLHVEGKLVLVKAEYKRSRQALEQHILSCPVCHSSDPF